MFRLMPLMFWAQCALISLKRIYSVSADPLFLPFTRCERMLSTTPLINVKPRTDFVLSGKLCSLGWAHYVSGVTSDLWLWSLPVRLNWSGFFLFFLFPSLRCRLSIGLAKLTCVSTEGCSFFQELTVWTPCSDYSRSGCQRITKRKTFTPLNYFCVFRCCVLFVFLAMLAVWVRYSTTGLQTSITWQLLDALPWNLCTYSLSSEDASCPLVSP